MDIVMEGSFTRTNDVRQKKVRETHENQSQN